MLGIDKATSLPPTNDKLLYLARLALFLLLLGGIVLAVALSAGLADPRTAGKLIATIPPAQIAIPPNQQIRQPIALPTPLFPPYTLILTAQFDTAPDPDAQWGIQLCDQPNCGESSILLLLTTDGFFNLYPFAPDTNHFIHLHSGAQPNAIYINVESSGHATIRLNHEIAWEGQFPTSPNPTTITLVGKGGKSQSSHLHLLNGTLYTAQ
jgi:hypothetical protein